MCDTKVSSFALAITPTVHMSITQQLLSIKVQVDRLSVSGGKHVFYPEMMADKTLRRARRSTREAWPSSAYTGHRLRESIESLERRFLNMSLENPQSCRDTPCTSLPGPPVAAVVATQRRLSKAQSSSPWSEQGLVHPSWVKKGIGPKSETLPCKRSTITTVVYYKWQPASEGVDERNELWLTWEISEL
jgi:hypothetical protein